MAREYELEIVGQATRYSQKARNMRIYFAEPENGAGSETGILLLIAGYGGQAQSHVYQKMRREFADKYNFVTLQCDYLGYSFMQDGQHMPVTEDVLKTALTDEEIQLLLEDYQANKELLRGKTLTGYVALDETTENYNEMGPWQAMDNLMAVKVLLDVLQENAIHIKKDKIYIYGQSHGAYLAYLCNFLVPGLFDAIIDNSAYLCPFYMFQDREVLKEGEQLTIRKLYHYLICDMQNDRGCYDLEYLYKEFDNRAMIVAYHGADDTMIPLLQKKQFLEGLDGSFLHEVTREQVDGEVFCNTSHGLGADFLKLFERALHEIEDRKRSIADKDLQNVLMNRLFSTDAYVYEVKWDTGIPLLYVTPRRAFETEKGEVQA